MLYQHLSEVSCLSRTYRVVFRVKVRPRRAGCVPEASLQESAVVLNRHQSKINYTLFKTGAEGNSLTVHAIHFARFGLDPFVYNEQGCSGLAVIASDLSPTHKVCLLSINE
jgi:hypothetical protein